MSSPSSSSSSSSALSQSTETTYSLALTFQVFKHGDEHQLLSFDVIKTVVLAGRPHDRIAKGLAMVNNIPEALPQYFFCGGDTAWISVDETMTHTLSPDTSGAAGECAIYANGWLRSPDMVELQVSEVRTAESYSLDVIKQKFLLLIKKHLGIQQDAPVGDLSAREQDLVGREQDLVGREQAFAGREQDLADREQVFEENGTEVKRLQAENNAKNVEQVQKISELANKHKDITTALTKREESVSVREAKVAAGEKAIESLKTQLMERANVISTNRKELENDVATLALNRARLNEEAASFKIAQNKLQEQMKAAAKSQKSNSSSESEDSDESSEDDEDEDESSEDDDDEDDEEVDQTGKRKRETNNASVKPLSKKAIKSWDNQRLQSLRLEYERICGREPGNRIRNNSTYMQKGIALAKKKAKR